MRNFLSIQKVFSFSLTFFLAVFLALLAGCGPGTAGTSGTTAGALSLSASPTEICTGNCTPINNYAPSTTVTVTALDSGNAALSGVAVSLSADTGILSTNSVTTDPTGSATFTFTNGTASKANRTATITASAGVTATLPVQIVGSTLTVNATGATVPGDGTSPVTMTLSAKDAGGNPIFGAAVTLTKPDGVTLTPASGKTDVNGEFVVSVTGSAPVSGSVTASAVGETASIPITVISAEAGFGISETQLNAAPPTLNPTAVAMQIGDALTVTVNAPTSANVTFATTVGSWGVGGPSTKQVPVVNGVASAILNTTTAGLANVEVYDSGAPAISDTLVVSMSATIPYKITLQASPSLVPKSLGTTTGSSVLIATVTNSQGQPVGNVPVAFTIINPTGGGENVSPVVVYTVTTATSSIALGQATTTFISGSQSSGASGIMVRATVLGTTVATNTSPSGNDAAIVIGGTAGSIAFGQATAVGVGDPTVYTLAMSVLVTDSNGNPAPKGTVVNLSAWPIAWSTGVNCSLDAVLPVTPLSFSNAIIGADSVTITLTSTAGIGVGASITGGGFPSGTIVSSITDGTTIVASAGSQASGFSPPPPPSFTYTTSLTITGYSSTYFNEDRNENLFLDPGEDGTREYYYTPGIFRSGGTKDGLITPVNSAGGVVVSNNSADLSGTVTTDATGLGAFTLTYPRTSAIWIVDRIRAQTVVQGSETLSEIQFPLAPAKADVTPTCYLGDSPYKF